MEKIFQIPYTLDPMERTGYERLIRSLMATAPGAALSTAPADGDLGKRGGFGR